MNRARYVRTVLAWHDVTQGDLAAVLRITPQAVNRKLKGIRSFSDDQLLAIAEAFELDPGLLLRPPARSLGELLGAVRKSAQGLLTCTKYLFALVRASAASRYGHPAKSRVDEQLRFT